MKFTETQKTQIAGWVAEGNTLAQIQTRIQSEFGVAMTYMDVRFLIDDLDLELRDAPAPKTTQNAPSQSVPAADVPAVPAPESAPAGTPPENAPANPPNAAAAAGTVTLSTDPVQIPGVIASGDVTFSDGASGKWLIDEAGRPGLAEFPQGYRPPAADMPEFQRKLVGELRKLGLA